MIESSIKIDEKLAPITQEMIPVIGFKTLKEMELYAEKNSTWPPEIKQLQIDGVIVWCVKMYGTKQFSTERILFIKYVSSRYKRFFEMPLSEGEFKVFQDGKYVSISRLDSKLKKHIVIASFYKVFDTLNDLAVWNDS